MLWATVMNGTKKCGWQRVTKMPHFLNMRIRQCTEKIHQQRNISCHYHFRYNMQMRLIWKQIPPKYSHLNIFIHLISFIYGTFQGNDHLIYNRSFFYLHKETERIVRHPLINGLPKATRIKRNRVVQNSGKSDIWDKILHLSLLFTTKLSTYWKYYFHCRWTTTVQTPLCSAAKC